jgi:hypothetical protein
LLGTLGHQLELYSCFGMVDCNDESRPWWKLPSSIRCILSGYG